MPGLPAAPRPPRNLDPSDLTSLVNTGTASRRSARDRCWERHYPDLRKLAAQVLSGERPHHTLQPTALVNEAYLRMVDRTRVTAEGTTFFKYCFATECRRILVDQAKARLAAKRGGKAVRHSLSDVDTRLGVDDVELLDLHEAIEALGKESARMAEVVDLRIFGGMTVPECAHALGVSTRTVDNDWAFARTWLQRQLAGGKRE